MLDLTNAEARQLLLAAQGLARRPDRPATREDVLSAIRRMGALQIDTIHVVARSPYLVLWSRLGSYEPQWLDDLLAERSIFEQWAHEASFLPIEDYPLHRRLMLERRGRAHAWLEAHPDAVASVLAYVDAHGEARSLDFERTDGRKGTWWDWKPEKRALDSLLIVGELMVARRERFQRVYARRERIMPKWDDTAAPDIATVRLALAAKAVRALGVVTERWLPDYYRMSRDDADVLLRSLAAIGDIAPARVEGLEEPAWVHRDALALLSGPDRAALGSEVTTVLSPFDPVVWHRERARTLFGLDFRLECYLPAPKRRFGYFALPLLHRGALVGQIDAKAHRAEGVCVVKALRLQPDVTPGDELVAGLAGALADCAAWHGTPAVRVSNAEPAGFADRLEAAAGRLA